MLGFQTHAGQNWHSHAHHEGRARGEGPAADGVDRYGNAVSDVVALPDHQPDLGLVRTLIYPEGFKARGDGGLKIVPGGHLEREATLDFGAENAPLLSTSLLDLKIMMLPRQARDKRRES